MHWDGDITFVYFKGPASSTGALQSHCQIVTCMGRGRLRKNEERLDGVFLTVVLEQQTPWSTSSGRVRESLLDFVGCYSLLTTAGPDLANSPGVEYCQILLR